MDSYLNRIGFELFQRSRIRDKMVNRKMRKEPTMTHDKMIAKWMENPEFRQAVKELDEQYTYQDDFFRSSTKE